MSLPEKCELIPDNHRAVPPSFENNIPRTRLLILKANLKEDQEPAEVFFNRNASNALYSLQANSTDCTKVVETILIRHNSSQLLASTTFEQPKELRRELRYTEKQPSSEQDNHNQPAGYRGT